MISKVMLYSDPSGASIVSQIKIGQTPMSIDETLLKKIPSGIFKMTYPGYKDLIIKIDLKQQNINVKSIGEIDIELITGPPYPPGITEDTANVTVTLRRL